MARAEYFKARTPTLPPRTTIPLPRERMKISTILDHIDGNSMALPEFQRGYVWNRDQVRGLMDSLYRRHPVGSLLVWVTGAEGAQYRGDGTLAPGTVKLLLDGQQRMTSLYGIVRGEPPRFFDGNEAAFTGLHFHLDREEFAFYSPIKMGDDPLWVDVTGLMKAGNDGLGEQLTALSAIPEAAPKMGEYAGRLSALLGMRDIDLHVEEVTGKDKTIDVVVDIFNRVNSGGTKLSQGDLALAKICADWPDARDRMKAAVKKWDDAGYQFNLDWLLRNMNTVITGEAKFSHLHAVEAEQVEDGLTRAEKAIDKALNLVEGRLGLDHDRVFFGKYAVPVMVHYMDRRGSMDAVEQDRLLFWFLHSAMWGRFSGSTESVIDKDLRVIEDLDGGLERLISELRLWHGSLRVAPGHFGGWSLGARFYPVLYLLTRVHEAKDWGTGLPLKQQLLGKMSKLEVHHIFPKAQLYKHGYSRPQVNAVANFCFLTKDTNLAIGAKKPKDYFPEIEAEHPGALASQWIPDDRELWELDNYEAFLEERRRLLAEAANAFLDELAHGVLEVEKEAAPALQAADDVPSFIPGGVEGEEEEQELLDLNEWVAESGLPKGVNAYEVADEASGDPVAVLDLAWPSGLQEGLSQPVAVLLNEGAATLEIANAQGFRYFTSVAAFQDYVREEVLAEHNGEPAAIEAP